MPLTWTELAKRTVKETIADNATDLAAQLAYYFVLALFPALLCILAITSFFPLQNFTDDVFRMLSPFAPEEVLRLVQQQMVSLAESRNGGLLSLGLVGAWWTASSAVVGLINALNQAYDITEGRPWWKVRIRGLGLTIALAIFIILSFMLVIFGPQLADAIARKYALGVVFVWGWKVLQWPIAFALVSTGIGLLYYFAPDAEQEWVWITPGSILATTLWLGTSLAFRAYVVNFGNYQATYGTIGAAIVLLTWLYLSGLAILIGAELNAEIEHASPWGKAPGEKVPGKKRKIGLAALKAYRDKWRHHRHPPMSGPVPSSGQTHLTS